MASSEKTSSAEAARLSSVHPPTVLLLLKQENHSDLESLQKKKRTASFEAVLNA